MDKNTLYLEDMAFLLTVLRDFKFDGIAEAGYGVRIAYILQKIVNGDTDVKVAWLEEAEDDVSGSD